MTGKSPHLIIWHELGPGNAAQELSKHFSHVYVSDPGELNIAAARQMLQPPEKFTCSRQPAEAAWLEDASVDLACICMALHFTDPDAAIYQAAKAMRPGGTLAICTYSFKVRFPRCPRLDSLWLEVVTVAVKTFLAGEHCIPRAVEGLQRVVTGLDYASLPEHLFHDVTRLRINAGGETRRMPFVSLTMRDLSTPRPRSKPMSRYTRWPTTVGAGRWIRTGSGAFWQTLTWA